MKNVKPLAIKISPQTTLNNAAVSFNWIIYEVIYKLPHGDAVAFIFQANNQALKLSSLDWIQNNMENRYSGSKKGYLHLAEHAWSCAK